MPVNCGSFMFPITLYYRSSDTVSSMGSHNTNFTTYSVLANMVELSDNQRIKLGMNIDESAFEVTFNKPIDGRVHKMVYNSQTYRVTSFIPERIGTVVKMICVKND